MPTKKTDCGTCIRDLPRAGVAAQIHMLLSSGLINALTMFAECRRGKTLFVHEDLIPATEVWRWRAVYIDLWIRRDQPAHALVEELERAAKEQQGLVKVKGNAKTCDADVEIHSKWDKAAATEDLQARLRAAMQRIVGSCNEPVLLIVDDFQTLAADKHDDFVAAFRATMQELQPRLKLLFISSSRNALNNMFRKRHAPMFESAMSITLVAVKPGFWATGT